jgi:hypothetical protein
MQPPNEVRFTLFGQAGSSVFRAGCTHSSTRRGRHHEIYLSDVRRADPSKWKTIVRQPMT